MGEEGYDVPVGGGKGVKVEEETYGCEERGKVTFMEQQRADTSSPRLRKATEVSCQQHPRTTPLAALSVSLPACWSVWSLFWAS